MCIRDRRQPIGEQRLEKIVSWVPTYLLCGMVVSLSLSPILDPDFKYLAGVICMVFGVIAKLWEWTGSNEDVVTYAKKAIGKIDWDTTFFLIGIFILVGVMTRAGVIERIASSTKSLVGYNRFVGFNVVVWFSILVSAFVDNVPYITAVLPVTSLLTRSLSYPHYLLPFGLLIGSCLGGNITPIGAAANIVAVGYLSKEGYKVSFIEFVRIGFPFTIAATVAGGAFIWFVWK